MRPANYRRYIIVLRVRITCSSRPLSTFVIFFPFFSFILLLVRFTVRLYLYFVVLCLFLAMSPFFPSFFSLFLCLLSFQLCNVEYKPSEMTMVARVPRVTLYLRVFLSTEVRSCTCAHSCTACAWKSHAEEGGSVKRAACTMYMRVFLVPAIVVGTRVSLHASASFIPFFLCLATYDSRHLEWLGGSLDSVTRKSCSSELLWVNIRTPFIRICQGAIAIQQFFSPRVSLGAFTL